MLRSLTSYPRVRTHPPLLWWVLFSVRGRLHEAVTLCRCTHPRVLHTHYSRSDICSGCTCLHFRRELGRGWQIQ